MNKKEQLFLEHAVAYVGRAIGEKQKPGDELEARAIANALWSIVRPDGCTFWTDAEPIPTQEAILEHWHQLAN